MDKLPAPIFNVMCEGLEQLFLLRLPSAPPAKALADIALVWERAFVARVQWSDDYLSEDVERLRHAFSYVLATAERWVAPSTVLDNLPPRKPPLAITDNRELAARAEIRQSINTLLEKMKQ